MLAATQPPNSIMSNMTSIPPLSPSPSQTIAHSNSSSHTRPSIGNYKGVMLCNRPFAGVSGASKHSSHKNNNNNSPYPNDGDNNQRRRDNGSFICGTVAKPWGINVTISAEKSSQKRRRKKAGSESLSNGLSKKEGALSKHKKWLDDLKKEKERKERERREKEKEKEDKKRKFMEREAKKRVMGWESPEKKEEGSAPMMTTATAGAENDDERGDRGMRNANNCSEEDADVERNEITHSSLKSDENGGKINKPAWALTKSAASEVEDKEEEDLLAFADGLDIDEYTRDLELKVLMDQVKERIKTLHREKNIDEARLKLAVEREIAAMKPDESFNRDDIKITSGHHDDDDDDDLKSIAESIRNDDASVGSIHSRRSMEALVAKARERMGNKMESVKEEEVEDGGEMAIPPPVLIVHKEDGGARIAETKSLNKLPFKNRNPALHIIS